MTTVLAVYTMRGCVGRCDANCHDATGDVCHCICQGFNHGFGLARAQENVAKGVGLNPEDLTAFASATKRDPKDLIAINRIKTPDAIAARRLAHTRLTQLELFELEEMNRE